MKIAFVIYHEVLEERITEILKANEIDTFFEWENVIGKFQGADGHMGTRTYPGHDTIRLIPFTNDDKLEKFVSEVKNFNEATTKKSDEIRIYLLPLEQIV